jgi:hypothetical protein
MSMTTNKQALREDRVKWLEKLSDLEYCKSNPGHWLMSLADTVLLANLALDSVNLCSKLEAAEKRIAELEAREVNLPKRSVGEVMHMSGFSRDYAEGWCSGNDNTLNEIKSAGITTKGE